MIEFSIDSKQFKKNLKFNYRGHGTLHNIGSSASDVFEVRLLLVERKSKYTKKSPMRRWAQIIRKAQNFQDLANFADVQETLI